MMRMHYYQERLSKSAKFYDVMEFYKASKVNGVCDLSIAIRFRVIPGMTAEKQMV